MASNRNVAANLFYLSLSRVIPGLLSFALLVLAARRLGTISFGQFSAAFAFTALMSTLMDLGLSYLVTREVARDRSQAGRYLSSMLLILGVLFAGTLGLTFLLVHLFGYRSPVSVAIYVLTFSWGLTATSNLFGAVFQAFERMDRVAVVWIARNGCIFLLGWAVLGRRPGVVPLAAAFAAGSLGGALLAYLLTDRRTVRVSLGFDPTFLKQVLVTGIPFGFALVLQTLYFRIDEVMLSVFRDPREVGLYAAAARVMQGLVLVPGVITLAVFPRLARWSVTERERLLEGYQRLMKYLFMAALPLAVAGTLLAPRLVGFLYGTDYGDASWALSILLWALGLLFLTSGANIVLNALDEVKTTARVLGVCLIVNLALNFMLIPSWALDMGFRGASIATVISEAVNLVLLLRFMSSRYGRLRLGRSWLAALGAAVPLSLLVWAGGALPLGVLILLGALVYGAGLLAAGGLDLSDRAYLRGIRGR